MKKITVIQKENARYTFTFDSSIEDSKLCNNGRYSVTVERKLSTGSSVYTENTTKEAGNELYKRLISKGFVRFKDLKDVEW